MKELPQEMLTLKDPYESGQLSDDEFVARSLDLLGTGQSPADFTRAWQQIFSPHQAMWDLATKLHHDGHRLLLFSNTNELHAQEFLRAFRIFDLFHEHHFSHRTGANKPDPTFYENAIRDFDLHPAETLYFDDLAENIATGEALGFRCHQYDLRNHAAAEAWLAPQLES
jgi:putative hydrolase of the HAD superfamily